jgi:Domain of unknown function (DUF5753)
MRHMTARARRAYRLAATAVHTDIKMTRQRVLTRDNPVQMAVVIDEATILRTMGGPEVMREQLAHLTAIAARTSITMRVLPLSAGAHPGTTGEFTILAFPDLVAPDDEFNL